MSPVRQGKPDWVNYNTHSPVAKGVRDHFGDDIIRAIHIGVDPPAAGGAEYPTLHPSACIALLMSNLLTIQETALASIALLGLVDADTDQGGFVFQHGDEARMRQHHKALVGTLAKNDGLLPPVILANYQRADAVPYQGINDATAGDMQITVDLALALVGQNVETVRGKLSYREFGLQLGATFVVPLIQRLKRTTVNQKGCEAGLV